MTNESLLIETVLDPISKARSKLEEVIQKHLASSTPILLLLSGGSNLSLITKDNIGLLNQTTIMPLDERYTADPDQNNSLKLQALGLHLDPLLPKKDESLEQVADRFNQIIEEWIAANPTGKIIATLGMGPDGHIAGISPFPNDPNHFKKTFLSTNRLAIGYKGHLDPPQRITTSPHFLQSKVDYFIGIITGKSKQLALMKTSSSHDHPNEIPARLLHKTKADIFIFTDQEIS